VPQANAVIHALGNENIIRESYSSGVDVIISLRDLQLGAMGDLSVIVPGRRKQFILGEQGSSLFCYKAVLLDSKNRTQPFVYHCGVFIVPKVMYRPFVVLLFQCLLVVQLNFLLIFSLICYGLQEIIQITGTDMLSF
jgi:hypothetical protein